VAGMFVMGGGYLPGTIPQALGALAVLLASVNVAGGFILTKRMLDMFKRERLHRPCFSILREEISPRSHRSPRIFMALFGSRRCFHRGVFGSCQHWHGRFGSGGIPHE
jgi:drug/metabolite transporter (DMT)-like permease